MTTTESTAGFVQLDGLTKRYEAAAGACVALDGVTLTLPPGEFVAIVGKSGSGKSTLVNLIAGIDRPTAGRVRVDGTEVSRLNENELAQWRGRHVGVVFQFFQLLPTLTVVENVMLPMDFCNVMPPRQARLRALELLHRVGIGEQADKLPSQLSGGQQQRAAIARALANDPRMVVADEPTGNLDSQTADDVLGLLSALTRDGKTVLMVTHERDLTRFADRIVTLADGKVVSEVTSERRRAGAAEVSRG